MFGRLIEKNHALLRASAPIGTALRDFVLSQGGSKTFALLADSGKRRALMEQWEAFLQTVIAEKAETSRLAP